MAQLAPGHARTVPDCASVRSGTRRRARSRLQAGAPPSRLPSQLLPSDRSPLSTGRSSGLGYTSRAVANDEVAGLESGRHQPGPYPSDVQQESAATTALIVVSTVV